MVKCVRTVISNSMLSNNSHALSEGIKDYPYLALCDDICDMVIPGRVSLMTTTHLGHGYVSVSSVPACQQT